ncbi:MAG: glycosyltransferase, partial [Winogradskyella arenosi]
IKSYISEDSKDSSHIITSRIDNDDCIHKDYISTIQKQFQSQDFMAIDILKGYSLQVSPEIMLGKKEHIFNPFISLIEKNEAPKTVWFSDHNMWKKESRRIEIANQRLWMSIIHEKNKVNEFDGYDKVSWDAIKTDFIVSDTIDEKVSQHIIPHKAWRSLSLKNKLYVNYVLMSKKLKKAIGLYKIK